MTSDRQVLVQMCVMRQHGPLWGVSSERVRTGQARANQNPIPDSTPSGTHKREVGLIQMSFATV